MGWEAVFGQLGALDLSRAELMSAGATTKSLTAAVRFRHLVRARRDHYLLPTSSSELVTAIRVGGVLDERSALREAGIFAMPDGLVHIHLKHSMSRTRSPRSRFIPLDQASRAGLVLSWRSEADPRGRSRAAVSVVDALAEYARNQSRPHAIAAIDSALHTGVLTQGQVPGLSAALGTPRRRILSDVDARAESGPESILRILIRDAGMACEPQVELPGVGRVDLVVERKLIVESDSKLAHEGWRHRVEDARRDLAAAELHGLATLRPVYEHTMSSPDLVLAAIRSMLASIR